MAKDDYANPTGAIQCGLQDEPWVTLGKWVGDTMGYYNTWYANILPKSTF